MCKTPEEAAWSVLAQGAEQQNFKVLSKIIANTNPKQVVFDLVRNAGSRTYNMRATLSLQVSDELLSLMRVQTEEGHVEAE